MHIEHSEEFDQYYSFVDKSESLEHFGILGMRWGIRRWQNKDGTLTPAGKKHYKVGQKRKLSLGAKVVKKGIKVITDETKAERYEQWKKKKYAERDVNDILERDSDEVPERSKATKEDLEYNRKMYGNKKAIDIFVREIAKEDLQKILDEDFENGKPLPGKIDSIVDEKLKNEKYEDIKKYLYEEYEGASYEDIFPKLTKTEQNNTNADSNTNTNSNNDQIEEDPRIRRSRNELKLLKNTIEAERKGSKPKFYEMNRKREESKLQEKEDKVYAMIYSNPQFYMNKQGQWVSPVTGEQVSLSQLYRELFDLGVD